MLHRVSTGSLGLVLLLVGCGVTTDVDEHPDAAVGAIHAGLSLGELAHDVSAIRFDVVAAEAACDATPIASVVRALEQEALPLSLAGSAGAQRRFADAFFVLPAGTYHVCATPLAGAATSSECAAVDTRVNVAAEKTNEVVLISQCRARGNGGLDVVVALNDPPRIEAVTLDPSKFVTVCESVTLSVSATDPNGDDITYDFAVSSGPEGSRLHASDASATFSGPAGDYEVTITATDEHGNPSRLSLPIHVSGASCQVPATVQAIFDASCSPCHTTGSSAGLRLADAATSYANLVTMASSAAACADRVRVVPGAPESSYLIAKLRNSAGICGMQMPRGRPALPEDQIQTVETWIASLPH